MFEEVNADQGPGKSGEEGSDEAAKPVYCCSFPFLQIRKQSPSEGTRTQAS